jgi:hypothetical protein
VEIASVEWNECSRSTLAHRWMMSIQKSRR